MRRSIFERELLPKWRNRLLTEITPDDLRAHCGAIVKRGAPATAVHVRDIVKQIYGFAILHGEKVANPADDVGPASIATFVPKDRSLSPTEIRVMLKLLEKVASLPTIRLGKVGGKVFAIGSWQDDEPSFTFKVSEISYEMLKEQPGLRPAPYLALRGMKWIQHYAKPG